MLFALFSAFMMILLLSACASVLIVHYNGCVQAACEANRSRGGGGIQSKPLFHGIQTREGPKGKMPKGKNKGAA